MICIFLAVVILFLIIRILSNSDFSYFHILKPLPAFFLSDWNLASTSILLFWHIWNPMWLIKKHIQIWPGIQSYTRQLPCFLTLPWCCAGRCWAAVQITVSLSRLMGWRVDECGRESCHRGICIFIFGQRLCTGGNVMWRFGWSHRLPQDQMPRHTPARLHDQPRALFVCPRYNRDSAKTTLFQDVLT